MPASHTLRRQARLSDHIKSAKQILKIYVDRDSTQWEKYLNLAVITLETRYHPAIICSSKNIVDGRVPTNSPSLKFTKPIQAPLRKRTSRHWRTKSTKNRKRQLIRSWKPLKSSNSTMTTRPNQIHSILAKFFPTNPEYTNQLWNQNFNSFTGLVSARSTNFRLTQIISLTSHRVSTAFVLGKYDHRATSATYKMMTIDITWICVPTKTTKILNHLCQKFRIVPLALKWSHLTSHHPTMKKVTNWSLTHMIPTMRPHVRYKEPLTPKNLPHTVISKMRQTPYVVTHKDVNYHKSTHKENQIRHPTTSQST